MLCPACEQEVKRRVRFPHDMHLEDRLVCPHCYTPIDKFDGRWVMEGLVPPVAKLERILVKNIKAKLDSIYPYVIPSHMQIRTKRILKSAWLEYYGVAIKQGLSVDQMLDCFDKSVKELLAKFDDIHVELGLLLWYISGKEHYLFKYMLGKRVKSMAKLIKLGASEDKWLD